MIDVHRQAFYYGKLLASMAKADRRMLNIEDVNAEALLERLCPEAVSEALTAYRGDKNVFWLAESGHNFASCLAEMPTSQKLDMLRALWSVAACDGEIHESEEKFMLKVTKAMMAKPEHCIEARKTVSFK